MIFRGLVGLKLPDIYLIVEEKLRKNFTQYMYPDRGSNPGPLRDRRLCYRLLHNSEQLIYFFFVYLPSPNLGHTHPGTYNPNARESDACRGSNSL